MNLIFFLSFVSFIFFKSIHLSALHVLFSILGFTTIFLSFSISFSWFHCHLTCFFSIPWSVLKIPFNSLSYFFIFFLVCFYFHSFSISCFIRLFSNVLLTNFLLFSMFISNKFLVFCWFWWKFCVNFCLDCSFSVGFWIHYISHMYFSISSFIPFHSFLVTFLCSFHLNCLFLDGFLCHFYTILVWIIHFFLVFQSFIIFHICLFQSNLFVSVECFIDNFHIHYQCFSSFKYHFFCFSFQNPFLFLNFILLFFPIIFLFVFIYFF